MKRRPKRSSLHYNHSTFFLRKCLNFRCFNYHLPMLDTWVHIFGPKFSSELQARDLRLASPSGCLRSSSHWVSQHVHGWPHDLPPKPHVLYPSDYISIPLLTRARNLDATLETLPPAVTYLIYHQILWTLISRIFLDSTYLSPFSPSSFSSNLRGSVSPPPACTCSSPSLFPT